MVEFDTPYALLCKEGGTLADLASQAGQGSREKYLEIAKAAAAENKGLNPPSDPDQEKGVAAQGKVNNWGGGGDCWWRHESTIVHV